MLKFTRVLGFVSLLALTVGCGARRAIQQCRERPFLLFLWYEAVHAPAAVKKEHLRKYQAKAAKLPPLGTPFQRIHGGPPTRRMQSDPAYAGMLENLDWNIGRLLEKLEELGLAGNGPARPRVRALRSRKRHRRSARHLGA